MTDRSEFVVVANRLPVDRVNGEDGRPSWRRSPGGLVTAIAPVMRSREGVWVGWSGAADEELEPFQADGMDLVPVPLSALEVERYYEGFSNSTLWPLYHDVIAPPVYERKLWEVYVRVNRRFAETAAEVAADGAVVWVQDYHLQLVPAMLRELRPDLKIGFFLHIPFPPLELFWQLPWRRQIIEGLLGADLVGFQRPGAASNFLRLARRLLDGRTSGQLAFVGDRVVRAAAFPISVDVRELERLVNDPAVRRRAEEIRADLGGAKILLGVDRLDYTKGIAQRLQAFGELFRDGDLKPGEATFVQIATPSRERVAEYRRLRDAIEQQVGRINGQHSELGVPVIHYLHTSYSRDELAALYLAADVMVVTPLRDGMNLVAKEYVACRADHRGALVLSEFAGAADELKRAYLVNPYDINGLKSTMLQALRAEPAEQARRMRQMRRRVIEHDVDRWAREFLTVLEEPRHLDPPSAR
ncbi:MULTISPECIES: alpha,alpha-trehalose-phosphate synthase (UDP-forming) [Thermomonospora]|uniref:Alpha,alpha-trehalose-phosphate synthase (UDP-forming) n=1 Tax=Thermomonospora curvata (strain ATCC 19995 / DSM 43183 / JCM 3096 / KCTC 9072 / NBRC 15933 / NCIMB 10081 / Henssen B9) TaxID=471852 RepID=D1ADS4_THECD|nr:MULTISPECIES: trehalose-6-phosphate synthase [Thermomonospora]ACY97534.1 Alpha,alpha-trehalose-phosphate synthase (UDP- forming) [Thermomonospora curvata DSM 43183]